MVQTIIDALQDKKGVKIVKVNLTEISDAECKYMLICTGNSPSHLHALARNVDERIHTTFHTHALAVSGLAYAHWVVIDYADVMVHLFLQEEREYYDLENLWEDADRDIIPDLD